ncbi:hypothetical protein ACFL4F_03505 [Candidatus Margulisiibacteriota bacterium]
MRKKIIFVLLFMLLFCISAYCLEFSAQVDFKYQQTSGQSASYASGSGVKIMAPIDVYYSDRKETHVHKPTIVTVEGTPIVKSQEMSVIYRYDKGVIWEVYSKEKPPYYIEYKIGDRLKSSDEEYRLSRKQLKNIKDEMMRVGSEYVAGKKCEKYRKRTSLGNFKIEELRWIYDNKIVLKASMKGSQYLSYEYEFSNIREGRQDSKLFELPPGLASKGEIDRKQKEERSPYKKVSVSDGTARFSFEIPKGWLVEKRHSGEKPPTIKQMRDFLATNKKGIKIGDEYWSDYCDYPCSEIYKLSDKKIKEMYTRTYKGDPSYPNASVAPAKSDIMYGDVSWDQVDFYIRNRPLSYYVEKYGIKRYIELADGRKVYAIAYPLGEDKYGNPMATKERTGGMTFFFAIPGTNKTLVVNKQAKMGKEFEDGFKRIITTLIF